MGCRWVAQTKLSQSKSFSEPGDRFKSGEAPEDETFSTRFCPMSEADPAFVIFYSIYWLLYFLVKTFCSLYQHLYHLTPPHTPKGVFGILKIWEISSCNENGRSLQIVSRILIQDTEKHNVGSLHEYGMFERGCIMWFIYSIKNMHIKYICCFAGLSWCNASTPFVVNCHVKSSCRSL